MYFVYHAIFEKQIKYQLLLSFSQYAQKLAYMILSIVLTKTLAKNSIFLLREKTTCQWNLFMIWGFVFRQNLIISKYRFQKMVMSSTKILIFLIQNLYMAKILDKKYQIFCRGEYKSRSVARNSRDLTYCLFIIIWNSFGCKYSLSISKM